MADRLTREELDEIRAREELEEAEYAAWSELPHDHQYDHVNMELYREACEDRAALLRHVDALEQELFDVESERENLFSIFKEHCENEERLEQEVERLRVCKTCGQDKVIAKIGERFGYRADIMAAHVQRVERKLARLVELLSAERKALKDVERFGGYGFDEVYLDAKRDTDYMLEALTNTATGEGK